jgi:hypothetical protein
MGVTFYHQVRADGGRRTGVSIDGSAGVEYFFDPAGPDDFDPALRWYVDLTWELPDAPRTQRAARAWYATKLLEIREVLAWVAQSLEAGIDCGLQAWVTTAPAASGPVRVAVAAQRRVDGVTVAQGIRSALEGDVDALTQAGDLACVHG